VVEEGRWEDERVRRWDNGRRRLGEWLKKEGEKMGKWEGETRRVVEEGRWEDERVRRWENGRRRLGEWLKKEDGKMRG
jgi:hypothetical protein